MTRHKARLRTAFLIKGFGYNRNAKTRYHSYTGKKSSSGWYEMSSCGRTRLHYVNRSEKDIGRERPHLTRCSACIWPEDDDSKEVVQHG